MKKLKKNWKSLVVSMCCLAVMIAFSVPVFAAGSAVSVTLNVNDTIAYSGITARSRNSAHVTGTVFAESKHGVEYRAKSRKNGVGGWFTRKTLNYNDSTYNQAVNGWGAPLGDDDWTLEIEPNGAWFKNCRATGTIDNRPA